MAVQHSIRELDRKGLREFGLTTGAIVAVVFGLLLPWLLEHDLPLWPWIVATPLWAVALVAPTGLRYVYHGWMRFGVLASRITTPIILGIVFYLMISPLAFVRRLAGRDSMRRMFEPDSASYRVPSEKVSADRLEKPF